MCNNSIINITERKDNSVLAVAEVSADHNG
jgi:hypothetical protein